MITAGLISFLVFLGVTKGFKDAIATCPNGPCRKFSGSVRDDTTTASMVNEWGPTIAGTVISVLLFIVVVTTKLVRWLHGPTVYLLSHTVSPPNAPTPTADARGFRGCVWRGSVNSRHCLCSHLSCCGVLFAFPFCVSFSF